MIRRFPSDLGDPGRGHGHAPHLTEMSELGPARRRVATHKRPGLFGMPGVARRVHFPAPVMFLVVVVGVLLYPFVAARLDEDRRFC